MASNSGYQQGTTAAPSAARRVLNSIAQVLPWSNPIAQATLTTALAGANNDLTYTARTFGTGGNGVTVAYVVAGANTPLSVSVTGSAITVNVATSAGSAATSTAAQVAAAVLGNAAASALVDVANAPGNDGTGVVTALTATGLTGGFATSPRISGSAPLPKYPGAGLPIHNSYN